MVRCAVVVLCYVHKQEVFISRRSREVRAMLLSQAVVPEVPNPEGNSILTYPAFRLSTRHTEDLSWRRLPEGFCV